MSNIDDDIFGDLIEDEPEINPEVEEINTPEPEEVTGEEPEEVEPEVVKKVPEVNLSETIAKAIADGFGKVAPAKEVPQEPQMTQEEINKALNVWDPDDDSVVELTNILQDPSSTAAERKKALAQLRDGLVKQANTYAHLAVQRAVQEIRREFEPVQTLARQRQQQQVENDFYSTYPALKEYKPVVQQVAQAFAAQGYNGADPKKDLAQKTFELIKRVNPNVGDLLKQTRPSGGTPRPAATHAGKTGHGQGASAPSTSRAASIW